MSSVIVAFVHLLDCRAAIVLVLFSLTFLLTVWPCFVIVLISGGAMQSKTDWKAISNEITRVMRSAQVAASKGVK